MNPIVLNQIPFTIETDELVKYFKIDTDSEDYEILQGLVDKAQSIAKPKAMYKVSSSEITGSESVLIDETELKSKILKINFEKIKRVFPYVVTCGTEIDEWSNTIEDILESYWVGHLKQVILGSAVIYLKNHLLNTFELEALSAMNPGSLAEWPLSEQKNLFKILGDVQGSIGVKLSESYLMTPIKSVSGIYFQTEVRYENCQLCPRKNCPGRRMPYDEKLLHNKYLK